MSGDLSIRPAGDADMGAIAAIMNDAILTGTGSLDSDPKSVDDMRRRFDLDPARWPVLVAEAAGTVVGWAAIGRYSDRCAYGDTGEVSIYVAPGHKGRGVGRALLGELMEQAWRIGFHGVVARVTEGNPASLALHRACGFEEAGFLKGIGAKFGRRHGVHILLAQRPEAMARP